MRTLILILMLSLISCTVRKKHDKELLILAALGWQSQQCRTFYGSSNALFFSDEYSGRFLSQAPQSLSIIGDSTMDISSRYTGWLSPSSVSYAVSGNTMCDMLEQNQSLNKTYKNVLIASNGGNDLLRRVPMEAIVQTFIQLTDSIKRTGTLTVIGIHPTRVDYANKYRDQLNSRIKTVTESIKGCYADPTSLFTLDSEGRTVQDQMLDSIHYSQTKSFEIKNLVKTVCNIQI